MPIIAMMTLRVTPALRELLSETAKRYEMSVSDVVHATAIGVSHGRPVLQGDLPETYYKGATVVMKFRNLREIPLAAETFRKVLAARCLEELARPEREVVKTDLVEGVDYIMECEGDD